MILDLLQKHEATAPTHNDNIWITLEITLDTLPMDIMLKKNSSISAVNLRTIPIITKAQEEKYMRECIYPEDKPCCMQEACECNFIDHGQPFIGVAFVEPQINMVYTGMCILCIRKTMQLMYYRIVAGGLQAHNPLQIYGNLCEIPDEYHESVMLKIPPDGPVHCMPYPIVAHQRNRYSVSVQNGKKILRQINVAFEDFH